MALYSFKEFQDLKSKIKGQAYLVDSSFLIRSLRDNSEEFKLKKALSGNVGFVYNVVIRSEVIHYTRYQLFDQAMKDNKISCKPSVKNLWDNSADHMKLKQICNSGYAEIFREVFGVNGEILQKEVEKVLTGCVYAKGDRNTNASNWEHVYAIVATYGLDSSDAMILNFAVGDATYSGLITSDADFRVCGDVNSINNFDIVVPESAKNTVHKKNWR